MRMSIKVALWAVMSLIFAGGERVSAQSSESVAFEHFREMTLACAGNTNMDEEILSCIGHATEACVAQGGDNVSDQTILKCLQAERDAWEWMMDTELEPALRQVGFWSTAFGFDKDHLPSKLRVQQQAWKQLRDMSCDLARDLRAPPSTGLGEQAYLECLSQMNAERYVELMNLSQLQ